MDRVQIPEFTTVELAIIAGAAFSLITLIIVGLDYYKTYWKTKRSDIKIRSAESRENYKHRRGERVRLYCNFVNQGKRDGVVRASKVEWLKFRPSGEKLVWDEMQKMANRSTSVYIDNVPDHTIPAETTVQGRIKINPREATTIEELIENSERVEASVQIDVEDNEGHYQIEFIDEAREK